MPLTISPDCSIEPIIDAAPEPVAVTWSFPAVDPGAWAGLECAGLDPEGRFHPSLGCFLLRVSGRIVLIDAGIGPGPNEYLGGLSGRLPERLAEAGAREADIDLVIFSHLHMDHIGWALGPDGPRFPNARYVAPARDVAHFAAGAPGMGEHHRAAYAACIAPLVETGRIEQMADGAGIAEGIGYFATPGHTPGHQSVLIRAGTETIAVTGDVFHCPAQIERPDWSHRADHDPNAARASRRAFLDRARTDDWLVAAGHFRAGLQLGRVMGDGETSRFVPEAEYQHHRSRRSGTAVSDINMEADT